MTINYLFFNLPAVKLHQVHIVINVIDSGNQDIEVWVLIYSARF